MAATAIVVENSVAFSVGMRLGMRQWSWLGTVDLGFGGTPDLVLVGLRGALVWDCRIAFGETAD